MVIRYWQDTSTIFSRHCMFFFSFCWNIRKIQNYLHNVSQYLSNMQDPFSILFIISLQKNCGLWFSRFRENMKRFFIFVFFGNNLVQLWTGKFTRMNFSSIWKFIQIFYHFPPWNVGIISKTFMACSLRYIFHFLVEKKNKRLSHSEILNTG